MTLTVLNINEDCASTDLQEEEEALNFIIHWLDVSTLANAFPTFAAAAFHGRNVGP
jgi:hypothetical protein